MNYYHKDKEALEKAIRSSSPIGYRVRVPMGRHGSMMSDGEIIEVLQEYRQTAIYKVRLDKPVPFHEYAKNADLSNEKKTYAEFERELKRSGGSSLPFSEEDVGEGLSEQDLRYRDLMNAGCLDEDQRLICIQSRWEDTELIEIKKGMTLEYAEWYSPSSHEEGTGGIRVWPGRIVGTMPKDKNPEGAWPIALLELFEPISYYRTPQAINNEVIKRGHYSEKVWVISYGLYEALEDYAPDRLPREGEWTKDKREFWMKEPLPLTHEYVEQFCKSVVPERKHHVKCFLQSLTLFIIPINVGEKGKFHPLRRDAVDDYITAIQFEYE